MQAHMCVYDKRRGSQLPRYCGDVRHNHSNSNRMLLSATTHHQVKYADYSEWCLEEMFEMQQQGIHQFITACLFLTAASNMLGAVKL